MWRLALVAVLDSCEAAQCSAVIRGIVGIDCHLQLAMAQLSGATVTVCRNQSCASGTFADSIQIELGNGLDAEMGPTATMSAEGTGSIVGIGLVPYDGDSRDGDTWSVTIVDTSNAVIFDASQVVTYTEVPQPCSPGSVDELSLDLR